MHPCPFTIEATLFTPSPPSSLSPYAPAGNLPASNIRRNYEHVSTNFADSSVKIVSDTIAALLDFNNLEHHEGFEAFDVNIDDKISMEDLRAASQKLDLGIHEDDLQGKEEKKKLHSIL